MASEAHDDGREGVAGLHEGGGNGTGLTRR